MSALPREFAEQQHRNWAPIQRNYGLLSSLFTWGRSMVPKAASRNLLSTAGAVGRATVRKIPQSDPLLTLAGQTFQKMRGVTLPMLRPTSALRATPNWRFGTRATPSRGFQAGAKAGAAWNKARTWWTSLTPRQQFGIKVGGVGLGAGYLAGRGNRREWR